MRRLATILIALSASPLLIAGTNIQPPSDPPPPRGADMPIGMCHQYCAIAIANAQRAAAASAQRLDAKETRLPQAICHQQCAPANQGR
jgi:hypothetical protein